MPELPEVEIIRKGLLTKVKGKKIKNIKVRYAKSFVCDKRNIINVKINDIKRKAKVLQIIFSNKYSLLIHLKMTGQLIYQKSNIPSRILGASKDQKYTGGHYQRAYDQPLPHKHTHVIYTFNDGSKLYFNDLRKFGWNRVVKTSNAEKILGPENFGAEPFTPEFTEKYLKKICSKSKKSIKDVLIDQRKISGIGNIYSSEILFYAKINPFKSANSLTDNEISRLKKATEKALKLGIEHGGSSDSTFVNVEGKKGKYLNIVKVYGRKGQKCKGCKGKVITKKSGGRTTYWCPMCQK